MNEPELAQKQNPGWDCVIPANVMYDRGLNPSARLLYGAIRSLTQREGYCWASNRYLAELFDVSETSVSHWIAALARRGYIMIQSARNEHRKIYLRETAYMARPEQPDLPLDSCLEEKFKAEPALKNSSTRFEQKFKPALNESSSNEDNNEDTRDLECVPGGTPPLAPLSPPSPTQFLKKRFIEEHRKERGFDPPWGAKEAVLLNQDVARLRTVTELDPEDDWLVLFERMIWVFMHDRCGKVAEFAHKAGYTYGVFHSQIDSMLAWVDYDDERRDKRR